MKKFAILIATVAMMGFFSSESYAQHYRGHRGHHGYRGGGTAWGISLGTGYGSGFTFGRGPYGNSFYGLSVNSGYRRAYRPVYGYGVGYGGFYGGGGCRGW